MKGLRLSHLTKVQFTPLRHFMAYIQEAHPVRLKRIDVINTPFFINQVMAIVRPLINKELMDLLHFTTESASSVLPLEFLPSVRNFIIFAILLFINYLVLLIANDKKIVTAKLFHKF